MAGRSIIIPRGTINPNQTNVIQIPDQYRDVQTLIARSARGQNVPLQPAPAFEDLNSTSPPSSLFSSPPQVSESRSNLWSQHATPSDYMSLPDPFIDHSTYASNQYRAASMPPAVHLSQFESQRRRPPVAYSKYLESQYNDSTRSYHLSPRDLRPEFESTAGGYYSRSNSRSHRDVSNSMASQHVSLPNPRIQHSVRASRPGKYGSLPSNYNMPADSPVRGFQPLAASSFKSLGPSTELFYDDTHWPTLSTWENNEGTDVSANIQVEKVQSHPSLGVITTNSQTNVRTKFVPLDRNVSAARSVPQRSGFQPQNKLRSAPPLQRPPTPQPAIAAPPAAAVRPMGRVGPRARTPVRQPSPPPAMQTNAASAGGSPIPSVHTSHITQGSRGGETYSAGGTYTASGTFLPMGNCHRSNCYCQNCCGGPPPPCSCSPRR